MDDFNFLCIPVLPFKTKAPLVVYPKRPLPFSFPPQSFQPVGGWEAQIFKANRCINRV
jgi:hypothetical protein